MTTTLTVNGRYKIIESDQTGATAAKEIAQALSDEGLSGERVVLFDISNTIAIAENG